MLPLRARVLILVAVVVASLCAVALGVASGSWVAFVGGLVTAAGGVTVLGLLASYYRSR